MWVETPLAGAVGWTILHSLWEGAIISAALAAALSTLRSSRLRYTAACVAMAVMLGGFGVTLVRVMPEGARSLSGARVHTFPAWNVRTDMEAHRPSNPAIAAAVPWLTPLWTAGVCIFYLMHAGGWVSVRRLRRRGVCSAPDPWQNELTRLCAQLHVSRPIRLLESCLVDTPMLLGHLQPFILMPVGLLAGLPAGQVEAILLHELMHIRRHDYLVNALQRFVEGLLFYHPAVWWMSRVMRTERENCCDDAVVAMSGNAREYAMALAILEEKRSPELAVAATGGNLVKRIRRLLYPTRPNTAWTPLFSVIVLIAIAASGLAAWQSVQPQHSSASEQQQAVTVRTSPFVKWLNEDVVYIITDEERAAFQKLPTDEEREKFIEQFWLRRDPTPGTVENEFKEEHYRRIEYTNERFSTASRTGWRTDRGHMYIIYGPPDELESHPQGAQSPNATEVWTYRYIDGVGDNESLTFIDRTGTGDYRLAPGNGR